MALLVSSTSYLLFLFAVLYKSSFINGEYCVIRFFFFCSLALSHTLRLTSAKENRTAHLHKTTALARTIIFTIIIRHSSTE